jgi:hypothetical protein
MSKKYWERNHFKERVKERFGIEINHELRSKIVSSILDHMEIGEVKTTFIVKLTNRRSVYLIEINKLNFTAIYDKDRHELITCMPKNSPEERSYFMMLKYGIKGE